MEREDLIKKYQKIHNAKEIVYPIEIISDLEELTEKPVVDIEAIMKLNGSYVYVGDSNYIRRQHIIENKINEIIEKHLTQKD